MLALFCFLSVFFMSIPAQAYDPLLTVVLMVKDEEAVITQTLEPFVKAGIHHYLIFDTGSTDKTVAKTQEYFKDQKVKHGHVFQEPFIDFATSRNRSLELAEKQFPKAAFFLVVDAEWYLKNAEQLLAFCKTHAHLAETDPAYAHSYLIKVHHTGTQHIYRSNRLLRSSRKLRYNRDIHEDINKPTTHRIPDIVYFEQSPSKQGDEKSAKRWLRDKELLLKAYEHNPHDSRAVFYLARTFEGLKDLENAYKYYKERTKLKADPEEDFLAMYSLAMITERRAMRDRSISWLEAHNYYLQAYSLRPTRAEPLVRIAQHYLQLGQSSIAYLYAHRAVELPFPTDEILLVEKDIYEFSRYDILSQCAWLEKEYQVGEQAILKAIECRPNCLHLYRNLAYYWEREQ
jgi:glycosyltransferase involved in cell wall biosynthesis